MLKKNIDDYIIDWAKCDWYKGKENKENELFHPIMDYLDNGELANLFSVDDSLIVDLKDFLSMGILVDDFTSLLMLNIPLIGFEAMATDKKEWRKLNGRPVDIIYQVVLQKLFYQLTKNKNNSLQTSDIYDLRRSATNSNDFYILEDKHHKVVKPTPSNVLKIAKALSKVQPIHYGKNNRSYMFFISRNFTYDKIGKNGSVHIYDFSRAGICIHWKKGDHLIRSLSKDEFTCESKSYDICSYILSIENAKGKIKKLQEDIREELKKKKLTELSLEIKMNKFNTQKIIERLTPVKSTSKKRIRQEKLKF